MRRYGQKSLERWRPRQSVTISDALCNRWQLFSRARSIIPPRRAARWILQFQAHRLSVMLLGSTTRRSLNAGPPVNNHIRLGRTSKVGPHQAVALPAACSGYVASEPTARLYRAYLITSGLPGAPNRDQCAHGLGVEQVFSGLMSRCIKPWYARTPEQCQVAQILRRWTDPAVARVQNRDEFQQGTSYTKYSSVRFAAA